MHVSDATHHHDQAGQAVAVTDATGHHHHAGEGYAARKHPEFVVIDIGEDLGALIVHTHPTMHGVEIEISPTGDDAERSHKQVLERTIGGQPAFTAVFDGLASGSYTLWVDDQPRVRDVVVGACAIAELDWRDARP